MVSYAMILADHNSSRLMISLKGPGPLMRAENNHVSATTKNYIISELQGTY